eukprot:4557632-Lingulodinium_polyedra.AAC.1
MEGLVQAKLAASLGLGWLSWTAVLLLTFYSIARPGKVVQARRGNSVFPSDVFMPRKRPRRAYLLLLTPWPPWLLRGSRRCASPPTSSPRATIAL